MTQTVYTFDEETREYIGSYERDDKTGTSIMFNDDRTFDSPPQAKEGSVIVRNADNTSWGYTEDHRGKTQYSIEDQSQSEVKYIGEIKEGFTLLKPEYYHQTWDKNTKNWVIDEAILLKEMKSQKLTEIKIKRNDEEYGGFEFEGSIFDSDEDSVRRINSAALAAKTAIEKRITLSTSWRLKDNSHKLLSEKDFLNLQQALTLHVNRVFEKSLKLKLAIDSAKTVAEVQAIQWDS